MLIIGIIITTYYHVNDAMMYVIDQDDPSGMNNIKNSIQDFSLLFITLCLHKISNEFPTFYHTKQTMMYAHENLSTSNALLVKYFYDEAHKNPFRDNFT